MIEVNQAVMQELMGVMSANNIIQNILGIPVIEIEQLNPRVRNINGVMIVKYHATGGDIKDPEGTLSYEYDWAGGEVEFVPNPYPRAPVGTGRVAFIADDDRDPLGKSIELPSSAMSGAKTGWNREFLASHYGEGYWRIVNPQIDDEIRERYLAILLNSGRSKDDSEKMVREAVTLQLAGMSGSQKVTVSRSSGPVVRETLVRQQPTAGEIENHPLVQAVRKENEELREMVKKLADNQRAQEKGSEKVFCGAKGKDGRPCKSYAKSGSKYCVQHQKEEESLEPAGNLGISSEG